MEESKRRDASTGQEQQGRYTSVAVVDDRYDYLMPNRYFRFYLFKEKNGDMTCWLPDGFYF